MSRGKFAEAAQAFIRIIPEQRQAVLQLTGDQEKLAASVPHVNGGIVDPVFASLSGAHGAGNYPVVSDGYCYVRRWTLYAGDFRSDRNFRKNTWIVAHDLAVAEGSGIIDLFLLFGFLLGIWMVPRFGRIRMQAMGLQAWL